SSYPPPKDGSARSASRADRKVPVLGSSWRLYPARPGSDGFVPASAGAEGGSSPPWKPRRPRAARASVKPATDSTSGARASRGPRDDHPVAWRCTPVARLERHLEPVGQRGERRVFDDETGAPVGIGRHRAE